MIPRFVESVDDFRHVVTLGSTTESLVLEFKRDLDLKKGAPQKERVEAQKELCRDIAQFANTHGGVLLFGIAEEKRNGKAFATAIAGLEEVDARRQGIEQAIRNYLVPSTFTHSVVPLEIDGQTVLAVNVPPHRYLVSLWDRDAKTIEYLRRTSHGKDWMNPDEAERHRMDGSRAAKIAFARATSEAKGKTVDLVSGVWLYASTSIQGQPFYHRLGAQVWLHESSREQDFTLELQIQNRSGSDFVRLPYGLIHEVWLGPDDILCLMLSIRLIASGGHPISMEPF